MKYYAIKCNEGLEIFESWDEAKEYMIGKSGISQKSFKSKEEAKAFLFDEILTDDITEPKAYIDGSYDAKTNRYSFGGVLIINNTEYKFKKAYEPDEYSEARNVAGEIKGAGFIINYCVNHDIKKVHIFFDYQGIEAWYKGDWDANSPIAKEYVKFRDKIKDKIEVIFHKVKSHTNNHYNDMADILAKEALGL